jgi:hypothetical protein
MNIDNFPVFAESKIKTPETNSYAFGQNHARLAMHQDLILLFPPLFVQRYGGLLPAVANMLFPEMVKQRPGSPY